MNLDDFGDFLKSPPYFGFNSAGPEKPCFRILLFQGPIRTQIDRGFFEDHYFPNMKDLSFETTQTELWRGKAPGGVPTPLGAPPIVFASSSIISRPSKVPDGPLDLKTPYIKVPEAYLKGGDA